MSSDAELLEQLRARVVCEIDNYVTVVPGDAIGEPWSDDRVREQLEYLRSALVDPYWVEVELRDSVEQIEAPVPVYRTCAVVADDQSGTLVVFDPVEREFVLATRIETRVVTFGVRGDAVGCFLAR